ncbi:metallophosphoesterase family protein [Virgibacillus sp. MSP4-1]|uniref:metallophosphoesterase family protein n=1 Tax=Virgibacillus sp. MSP4-1 TaxID=2700081 RepID=UPI000399B83B|nr:metallophosphoesterase family protein [Virgibacillus sp. MSP4-1]QHS21829.1 metallophosphoesterase family protein [Virgibacillus sp. MSP4-1]
MKIIVTGDTHISGKNKQLPPKLLAACEKADLIIHTGDWKTLEVYRTLREYAKVIGVYGNVDGEEITDQFPVKDRLEIKGYKIGMVHGHGEKKTTEKRAIEAFQEDMPDILIFGHSHIPLIRYFKKTLLMNPGSPTDKRKLPFYSFGVLEIGEELRTEIVYFK